MTEEPKRQTKWIIGGAVGVLALAFAGFFLLPEKKPNDPTEETKAADSKSAAVELSTDQTAFQEDLNAVATIAQDLPATANSAALDASLSSLKLILDESDSNFVYSPSIRSELEALLNEAIQLRRAGGVAITEATEAQAARSLQASAQTFRQQQKAVTEQRISAERESASMDNSASQRTSELDSQAKNMEAELERQLALEKKQLLEFDFQNDLREIQSLLAPFLAPGTKFTTPDGKPSITGEQPTSLEYLQKRGYLKEDVRSMENFMQAATNRRLPMGAFPAARGGFQNCDAQTVDTVRRAHALMLKYGELLVEKGMLSP